MRGTLIGLIAALALVAGLAVAGPAGAASPALPVSPLASVLSAAGIIPIQQAELTAADGAEADLFGASVAVSGDTAVVGAPDHFALGVDGAGAAYVYTRTDGVWAQQALLTASDGAEFDAFGSSVAISGDSILVGAPSHATLAGAEVGAAYVFTRTDGAWSQQAALTPSAGEADAAFGYSVALDGDSALVGAPYRTVSGTVEAGGAYAFSRSGTSWTEQAALTASDGAAGDWLGTSVAVSGTTALAGADGHGAGAAYVYVNAAGSWAQQAVLAAGDAAAGDSFGAAVTLAGDTAVIGAPAHDLVGQAGAGAAYAFTRTGAAWTQAAKLTAADAAADDSFGASVSFSGVSAVVGAVARDSWSTSDSGGAYVFVHESGAWSQQAELTASDFAVDDQFGGGVALAGRTALVGANGHASGGLDDSGAAYVFSLDGTPLPPAITGFTPAKGKVGASVTINGEGFTGATSVTFNGKAAPAFPVVSDAHLAVTVPAGAKSGRITVTTPLGKATSAASFTVLMPPHISCLRPAAGHRRAIVTITGSSFGKPRGRSTVSFGSKRCTKYISWSSTRIKCRVPAKARFGKLKVTVKTAVGRSNTKTFRVKR